MFRLKTEWDVPLLLKSRLADSLDDRDQVNKCYQIVLIHLDTKIIVYEPGNNPNGCGVSLAKDCLALNSRGLR